MDGIRGNISCSNSKKNKNPLSAAINVMRKKMVHTAVIKAISATLLDLAQREFFILYLAVKSIHIKNK